MGAVTPLIDGNYTFNNDAKEEFRKWGFYSQGFDYNIVSILGSQSGGKSTLLNMLFGTAFDEMNAEDGRGQTTLGLWTSYDKQTKSLVMDVEGTDSKERGDEHMNFERKSALFSLALAEILLVNMWCSDIGRYTASNYGTLKIVMELHLELFPSKSGVKTLLLFVLRDHTQKTSLIQFAQTLTNDVEKIWGDIQKPAAYTDTPLSELFDLDFCSLPHKELQEDKFMVEVGDLRKRFADNTRDDFLFKQEYRKQIPADGLVAYAENIWETIRGNKDLDIPTQKEILSMYRCDEILAEACALFHAQLEPLVKEISGGNRTVAPTDELRRAGDDALAGFNGSARRYVESVYTTRLTTLTERILCSAKQQIQTYLELLAKKNMSDDIELAFAQSKDSMWADLGRSLRDHLALIAVDIDDFSVAFQIEEGDKRVLGDVMKAHARSVIKNRLVEENKFMQVKLKQSFEKKFKFDENRVPRMWGKDDNIAEHFTLAKKEAMRVLSLFANMNLDGEEGRKSSKEAMVTTARQEEALRGQFEQDVEPLYREAVEAQRRQLALTGIPPWVYVVIMILGFNEVMMVLANPLLLIIVALLGGCGYALHVLNLSGPAMAVALGIFGQGRVALTSFVESLNEQQQNKRPHPAPRRKEE